MMSLSLIEGMGNIHALVTTILVQCGKPFFLSEKTLLFLHKKREWVGFVAWHYGLCGQSGISPAGNRLPQAGQLWQPVPPWRYRTVIFPYSTKLQGKVTFLLLSVKKRTINVFSLIDSIKAPPCHCHEIPLSSCCP